MQMDGDHINSGKPGPNGRLLFFLSFDEQIFSTVQCWK